MVTTTNGNYIYYSRERDRDYKLSGHIVLVALRKVTEDNEVTRRASQYCRRKEREDKRLVRFS